tara:strand:+ start:142 stop:1029 length:888 start_codon:yes stop_codon:yes gene_type:complete
MKFLIFTLLTFIFSFSQNFNKNYQLEESYKVKSPHIPKEIFFCDEKVPIKNQDILERFDKEILVNTYYHSKAILILKRSNKYFPTIEKYFKKHNIPSDLKYVAITESALENVTSPAGAKGFWQFMPKTGKAYGLEINELVDERYNLEKSTEAACKYLLKLYNQFGSWTLATAAYNMGPNALEKQLKKQKVKSYYDLKLNNETSRYIFRIIAYKLIDNDPKKYGFNLEAADLYPPIKIYKMEIKKTIENLSDFAININLNYKIIKYLNPWILKNKIEVKDKFYTINLPLDNSLEIK